jgi:N-acetylneuraminate lyase
MTTAPLRGIHVALLSGFSDDGAFNERRQRIMTEYAIRQAIDGLYVGGSSAEAALMGRDELAAQLRLVADLGKAKTLIAHIGQPSTRDSVYLATIAREAGYRAVSALPPFSFPYSIDQIADFYRAIVDACGLPLIVYEVPSRVGRASPLEQLETILSLDGVVGMKFTSPDLFLLRRIQKMFPDKIFFFGIDEMFAAAATLGVDGGIGTTYNLVGGLYRKIHDAIAASDVETARTLQHLSQDLVEHIFRVGVIPGVKHLLSLHGVDVGPSRLPLKLGPAEHVEAMTRWFRSGALDGHLA